MQMPGTYNIQNIICMAAMMHHLGVPYEDIVRVIPELSTPNGRYNVFNYGTNNIIVDYAHTPDAMEKTIEAARGITKGNIYTVFGCPGSRDRYKRPVMLHIALTNCAFNIITVDDLNNETAEEILHDMFEGNTLTNYEIELNRKEAIYKGISHLQDNDTLLIMGKGHEDFIKVGKDRIPHNDVQVVKEFLERNGRQ
jgi:UDP-N-acetylmuramoyl-L-alanyl-D-glutamate--2,6-diaminopimelate ligase